MVNVNQQYIMDLHITLAKHGIIIETWGRAENGEYLWRWRINRADLVLNSTIPYPTVPAALDACLTYLFDK